MDLSITKSRKVGKLFRKILIILALCMVLVSVFSLSPQWCLSKHRVWKAQEIDLTIYVSEEYETDIIECFNLSDRDELRKYVRGKVTVNGVTADFEFSGEDHFQWISFGDGNMFSDETSWLVSGGFGLVFNPKKLKFKIDATQGDFFPKDIDTLTLVAQ